MRSFHKHLLCNPLYVRPCQSFCCAFTFLTHFKSPLLHNSTNSLFSRNPASKNLISPCSLSILVSRSTRSQSLPRSRFPSCSQALAECCWTSCRQTCFTAVWTLYFFFIIIIPSIISSLASFSEPVLSRWKTSVPSAQMQQPMNQIGAYTNCKEHNVVDWQCFAFIGKQFCHHYNIQHTSEEPS